VPEIVFSVQFLVFRSIWFSKRNASAIAETMYFDVLANKNNTLAGDFGFVGA